MGEHTKKNKSSKVPAEAAIESAPPSTSNAASNAYRDLTFEDVLEDLSSRFIVNLPADELSSIERICFQVEQAHWFYEDFLRPLNPSLPSYSLRRFSEFLLHTSALSVPVIQRYISGKGSLDSAFEEFLRYKTRVPVCGAILITKDCKKCLLVKGWKSSSAWGFPKGKINQNEPERDCAVREVLEETGYDCSAYLPTKSLDFLEMVIREQRIRLYIVPGIPEETHFEPLTRKEISQIAWFNLGELPTWRHEKDVKAGIATPTTAGSNKKFYLISPFIGRLKAWLGANRHTHPHKPTKKGGVGSTGIEANDSGADTPVAVHALPAALPQISAPVTPAKGVPAFPDSSAFPPLASGSSPSKAKIGSSAPPSQGPSSDGLKALLGIPAAEGRAAIGIAAPAAAQANPLTNGKGAQMIESGGDARSRQLLDLLRGAGIGGDSPVPQPAHASATAPVDEEREKGAKALLAALTAGAGHPNQPIPMQDNAGRSTEERSSQLLDLVQGRGAGGSSSVPASSSPGPPAVDQKSVALLGLLNGNRSRSAQSVAPQDPRTIFHGVPSQPPAPFVDLLPPPVHKTASSDIVEDMTEAERARKRDALLAGLMQTAKVGGSQTSPSKGSQHGTVAAVASSPTKEQTLLGLLNGGRTNPSPTKEQSLLGLLNGGPGQSAPTDAFQGQAPNRAFGNLNSGNGHTIVEDQPQQPPSTADPRAAGLLAVLNSPGVAEQNTQQQPLSPHSQFSLYPQQPPQGYGFPPPLPPPQQAQGYPGPYPPYPGHGVPIVPFGGGVPYPPPLPPNGPHQYMNGNSAPQPLQPHYGNGQLPMQLQNGLPVLSPMAGHPMPIYSGQPQAPPLQSPPVGGSSNADAKGLLEILMPR